ncbi:MAG: hypothetical protein AB1295_03170 [Candidatus Micrarchaeota archaeon]
MADFTTSFYADWQTISIGAAAIAVLGSAGLIMLSRIFSLKNLEQIAKTEFVYAASTVLIVIMTMGLIQVVEPKLGLLAQVLYLSAYSQTAGIMGTLTVDGQPVVTLIDWMKLYMSTPTRCVQQFMDVLYALAVPIGAITSIYMEIFMSEHASGFGMKWVEERIMNATQSFAFFVYISYLLAHVMNFVKYYSGFFFSLGVALRSFPPTRGAGAYVMALSFGLYFVFPLTYIMIATLGLPNVQSNLLTFDPNAAGGPEYICALPQPVDLTPWQCGMADAGKITGYFGLVKSNMLDIDSMVNVKMIDFEKYLINSICIFPFVAFVILLTFVLNTTTLFGGNIPEIGRGLVKLI